MKNLIYILGIAGFLTSCHAYDNFEKKNVPSPVSDLYRDTTAVYQAMAADTVNFGNTPWQEVFTDPQLQVLIEKALSRNTDLLVADQSVRSAQANYKASRLAFLPSAAFAPQGTISSYDFNKAVKSYGLPITASWQIDANGSLRNAKKQAAASVLQAKAGKQAARTSIIAAVANLYYSLEMLDEQLKVTKSTAEIWKKNYETIELMAEAGTTTYAGVASAKANYHSVLAAIPSLEDAIASAENSLCLLLREAPHPIARGKAFTDDFPVRLAAGVPLQLLANRPDVKLAELDLVSAFYGVAGAYSNFYPSINLTANGAWTNNAGMILNPGKFLATAVGSLTQPLFQRGRLKANLEIAKANQETAQLNFEQALLKAGSEVSNYLKNYQSAIDEAAATENQVKELESAAEKTMLLFKYTNQTSYLETLTAESSLLNARLSLINKKFDRIQAAINLYTALGGGREAATQEDMDLYDKIVKSSDEQK